MTLVRCSAVLLLCTMVTCCGSWAHPCSSDMRFCVCQVSYTCFRQALRIQTSSMRSNKALFCSLKSSYIFPNNLSAYTASSLQNSMEQQQLWKMIRHQAISLRSSTLNRNNIVHRVIINSKASSYRNSAFRHHDHQPIHHRQSSIQREG